MKCTDELALERSSFDRQAHGVRDRRAITTAHVCEREQPLIPALQEQRNAVVVRVIRVVRAGTSLLSSHFLITEGVQALAGSRHGRLCTVEIIQQSQPHRALLDGRHDGYLVVAVAA